MGHISGELEAAPPTGSIAIVIIAVTNKNL